MRVVCEGCLRSVEIDQAGPVVVQAACPFCGQSIDSRSGVAVPSEDETHIPAPSKPSRGGETPETIDWAKAWSRGTLGSLGRFQLRERLGDGGFGQVFLAYDPRLDRDVALKVLKQPDPSDRIMERFFREARAVARLDHPNIVAVHDAGVDDGRCWVAYQLVSGRPLWWYRDRQRMDATTAARIIRDLADAVGHAHAMGVVHRDIKPGNVMIDDQGRPRLIDFGLARRSDVESDLTRDGVVVGTPAYMSPEQAIGMSRQADERSDVYSLGVLFFELLCGRRPHQLDTSTPTESPPSRLPKSLPDIRTVSRGTPSRLAAICARAMSPRPADRYPTARALMEDIDAWQASRRSRGLRFAIGATMLVLLLGMALSALSIPRLVLHSEVPALRGQLSASSRVESSQLGPPKKDEPPGKSSIKADRVELNPTWLYFSTAEMKLYHLGSCHYAKQMSPAKRERLESLEAAQSKGLKPHTCAMNKALRPPESDESETSPSD